MISKRPHVVVAVQAHTSYGIGIVEGVRRFAETHHWEVVVLPVVARSSVRRMDLMVRDWGTRGLIIMLVSNERGWMKCVAEAQFPTVNVLDAVRLDGVPVVCPDDHEVGRLAARHLLERGYTSFGYLGCPEMPLVATRQAGFAAALAEAGRSCSVFPTAKRWYGWNWSAELRQITQWIRSLPKPLGIFGCQDWRGEDLLHCCRDLRLNVPRQVGFVGVENDTLTCTSCRVPLSSVDVLPRQIGWQAARLLQRLWKGQTPPKEPLRVPPGDVLARQSSDAVAIKDGRLAAAVRYIRDHAHEPIGVSDVVRAVAVSRTYLEKGFHEALDVTPGKEILRQHLRLAQTLLSQTDLRVPEIARASGFASPVTFAMAFKRELKTTPMQYRKRRRLT